ncbi:MAG: hypothetical protein HY788_10115 [Deltaproteobacteria bacterium]|nr:hypothetical protein [Deltaproteobacteria bacterium]
MVDPPGIGQKMPAKRIPTVLPALSFDESPRRLENLQRHGHHPPQRRPGEHPALPFVPSHPMNKGQK